MSTPEPGWRDTEALRFALAQAAAMMLPPGDALAPLARSIARHGDPDELAWLQDHLGMHAAVWEARTVLAEEQAAKLKAENIDLKPLPKEAPEDVDPDKS